jgi:hypothetical protein
LKIYGDFSFFENPENLKLSADFAAEAGLNSIG